jgi:hypothetical protein
MDFRLKDTRSLEPVLVGGRKFKVVRSASVFGGFSDNIDRAELDFYRRGNHMYVRVGIYNVFGGYKEHHWRMSAIIDVKPEELKCVRQFLPFAKSLGIAATCLVNMIKGVAPHHAPLSK